MRPSTVILPKKYSDTERLVWKDAFGSISNHLNSSFSSIFFVPYSSLFFRLGLWHPPSTLAVGSANTPTDIFLVMEYVSGGELFHFIVRHWPLPLGQVRRFFQQIIAGVEYTHYYHSEGNSLSHS